MQITRREAFRLGVGALCTSVMASIMPAETALAVIGVDDAVLGGVVLAMLTLAGYAVSAKISQATLQAIGYSFSDFCADSANQTAAVTQAIADANNLGVQVNRQNAEDAAAAIASGTGAFADWLTDVASTGRATIDGWLGGVGANQAALWGLVGQYVDNALSAIPQPSPNATVGGASMPSLSYGSSKVYCAGVDEVLAMFPASATYPDGCTWAAYGGNSSVQYVIFGDSANVPAFSRPGSLIWATPQTGKSMGYWNSYSDGKAWGNGTISREVRFPEGNVIVAGDLVVGPVIPGVDRAPDAPATLGAGYDKTILGNDMVMGQDGAVVSPGSIVVPVQLPVVDVPYSDALYGNQAGVIQGLLDVPISGSETVTVGTGEGVQTMPVSQAIATSTSIAASTPVDPSYPTVPPGTPDVGPWTPAYSMPFMDVWPFNMIYTFVDTLSALGGS